jgi:hypothetical protein
LSITAPLYVYIKRLFAVTLCNNYYIQILVPRPAPLGVLDHPVVLSSHLDKLAQQGILFRRAYSECPVCIPAGMSIMTGLRPATTEDSIGEKPGCERGRTRGPSLSRDRREGAQIHRCLQSPGHALLSLKRILSTPFWWLEVVIMNSPISFVDPTCSPMHGQAS